MAGLSGDRFESRLQRFRSRWLGEVYEPVVRAIPAGLRAAASDYFATVLPGVPGGLTIVPPVVPR